MTAAALLLAAWLIQTPSVTHAALPLQMAEENWQDLSPRQRYDALQNYWEHERLPKKRQKQIERDYQRWQSMPKDERDRIRQNYQRYRALPSPERDRFHRKYERWKHKEP